MDIDVVQTPERADKPEGLILVAWLAIDELPDHDRRFASIRSHQ